MSSPRLLDLLEQTSSSLASSQTLGSDTYNPIKSPILITRKWENADYPSASMKSSLIPHFTILVIQVGPYDEDPNT